MTRRALSLFLLAATCSGCFSMGRKIDQSAVAQIKQGKTTKAEVLKLLGSPDQVTWDGFGNETFMYMYVRSTPKATTFVPVVGAFSGGANTQSEMVMVTFNPQGVVSHFVANMGATEAGYGAEAASRATDLQEVEENKRPK